MLTALTRLLHRTTPETVAADLSQLGGTPTDIAGTLAILRIKGERCIANACPVANYLRHKGHYDPSAGLHMIYAGKKDNRIKIMIPESVYQFMAKFDNGGHPELEM